MKKIITAMISMILKAAKEKIKINGHLQLKMYILKIAKSLL